MKRITLFLSLLFILTSVSFTSCKKDAYLDWKYLNEQWLNERKGDADWGTADGWKETSSGLQYKIIYGGIGSDKPSGKSAVSLTYTGKYINEKEFDSAENTTLYVSNVVSGFAEGLRMMKRNAIYEFRVPWNLGYGNEGYGNIPPYTTLQFQIELIDFITAQ